MKRDEVLIGNQVPWLEEICVCVHFQYCCRIISFQMKFKIIEEHRRKLKIMATSYTRLFNTELLGGTLFKIISQPVRTIPVIHAHSSYAPATSVISHIVSYNCFRSIFITYNWVLLRIFHSVAFFVYLFICYYYYFVIVISI